MYIKRKIEDKLSKFMSNKEILAVIGPRRCGKTTVILEFLNDYKQINNARINSISFDDLKILNQFENNLDEFVEKNINNYDILFIDEIQYSKDSGKKLKYIYDKFEIKIIVSGSSSPEISIHCLKFLVGRIFVFNMFPFDFEEFLIAKNSKILETITNEKVWESDKEEILKLLKEYLMFGGYPQVVIAKDEIEKKEILRNLYNTYILREINEIIGFSNNFKLIRLLKLLALQIGNLIDYSELKELSGFTSIDELKKVLKILEDTYICKLVTPFFTNKRTELSKNPKVYFFDSGFRNVCADEILDKITGDLFENWFFSQILFLEKTTSSLNELKFWRTQSKAEVDFIYKENTPIEIKINFKAISKSMYSFIEKYNPKNFFVFTLENENEIKRIKNTNLKVLSFYSLFNTYRKEFE
jgi:uncharacterized protein